MRRELPGGFELDDDPARIDLDAVHGFLSEESYWAKGRPRDEVERLVREAGRVVGLYHGDRQVGFTRTVSDGASFAYALYRQVGFAEPNERVMERIPPTRAAAT